MATDLPNVAQRLQLAIESARGQGFEVRKVVLDEPAPGWVRVGNRMLIFLDLSSSTTDQLAQLCEILDSYRQASHPEPTAARQVA